MKIGDLVEIIKGKSKHVRAFVIGFEELNDTQMVALSLYTPTNLTYYKDNKETDNIYGLFFVDEVKNVNLTEISPSNLKSLFDIQPKGGSLVKCFNGIKNGEIIEINHNWREWGGAKYAWWEVYEPKFGEWVIFNKNEKKVLNDKFTFAEFAFLRSDDTIILDVSRASKDEQTGKWYFIDTMFDNEVDLSTVLKYRGDLK